MERPQPETGGRRRMEKNKERVQFLPPGRMLSVPPMARPPAAATNEVRLAAIAVELNIRLRSADMAGAMQEHAFRFSRALLDTNNLESKNPNPTHIAMSLKKNFLANGHIQGSFGTAVVHLSLASFPFPFPFLFQEFDAMYGIAWHCIVGKSYGSFVTHSSGGFVYFSVDNLSFLLFKTEVQPVKPTNMKPTT
ncbi:hypothetical protein POTOM_012040 [Populus tomentosa]|uniref:Dynein light chain n=1 Tax=Populus tomentosa TaxID=118781 RepID=A0A8X8D958_POPTO|nr:hypothetical protein POTOM_012040 [Populus tomentosa]